MNGNRYRGHHTELAVWIVLAVLVFVCLVFRHKAPWLINFPETYTIPLSSWLNTFMEWFVEHFRWLFQGINWVMNWPLVGTQSFLHWLPWPVTFLIFSSLAFYASGWRLAAFSFIAMSYMLMVGYWNESMNTLALVFVAIPLSVSIGFVLGVLSFFSKRMERIVQPTLDLMQVIPTFAYLIPILLLFGFGMVVGLVATAIYACPPMVRNVILALRRVPKDIVESGQMSGTTRGQLFWWVQVPTAMPTIMIGINQTIMAALSMVIITSIIGSSNDIGWEVLNTMRRAQFGNSLLAGIVIAIIAMLMDRISRGFVDRTQAPPKRKNSPWFKKREITYLLIAVLIILFTVKLIPSLGSFHENWTAPLASPLDSGIEYMIANYSHVTDAIKNTILFFFLLPLKIGFESTVRPFTWGFELSFPIIAIYASIVIFLTFLVGRLWNWRVSIAVSLLGLIYYFGISRLPWSAFILITTVIAWQIGGWKTGLFGLGGLLFMLLTGIWPKAMVSVYLCGAAALTSFILGGFLGSLAAHSNRVSAIIRPIIDTLQTMPLFVFLIPVMMFFRVGEFSAFLAVIAYAVVPAIRYTEHGLRQVPPDIVEASQAMGCARRHILFQVKLPLALPEIMLGLNQTIMFALAMLVITALVGSKGLGQIIYIGLTSADFGKGIIAGFGMALIAMIADRIIQAWSIQQKTALGIT